MPASPEISVIIPTCNRPEQLKACLDRLYPQANSLSCQVIVTDDGQNAAQNFLAFQYPWVTWVRGPGKGPAANRNFGAAHALGDWLIFIDDDCLPDPDFLESYHNYFKENPHVYAIEGVVYPDRPQQSLAEGCPQNVNGGCFWSCNIAFLREYFQGLGGFDPDYPYPAYEDMDISLRVRKRGGEVAFAKTARVCHPWKKLSVWRRFWQQRRSTLIYLDKHPDERARVRGREIIKVAAGRIIKSTIPQGIAFSGRGLPQALLFDGLDLLFGLFLGARNILRLLSM
jgi:GT2 family glycosyltransferase